MKFKKLDINTSPHIGIYASVSNNYGLFPDLINKKDEKAIQETLDIDLIKLNLGESIVNGSISKIYDNKVVLAKSSLPSDVKYLEKKGLDVLRLNSYLAVGNLIVVNKNGLLLCTEFSKDEVKQ
jgi:translation initiation factor 6 (eIF-6)